MTIVASVNGLALLRRIRTLNKTLAVLSMLALLCLIPMLELIVVELMILTLKLVMACRTPQSGITHVKGRAVAVALTVLYLSLKCMGDI